MNLQDGVSRRKFLKFGAAAAGATALAACRPVAPKPAPPAPAPTTNKVTKAGGNRRPMSMPVIPPNQAPAVTDPWVVWVAILPDL